MATHVHTTLLGRDDERETLERLLAQAHEGVSGALLLEGEAGVGKTALLAFAERAGASSGMQVARAAGVQPEADTPYSGLHQLLLPFLDGLERIPESYGDALRSAFGLISAAPRDCFFVGMAALALLSDAAMGAPVLCLIDDADRLDTASIDALGFTARRMLADRLVMIFAACEQDGRVAALEGLKRMRISGLDSAAAHELLARTAGAEVDDAVAAGIATETHGQPLAIIEVASQLSTGQLAGSAPMPELLPLGGRLEDLFAARIRALPSAVQTLLLLAAADPSGDLGLISRAGEHYGLQRAAADTVELRPFVSFTPQVRFHESLMRSAAYYSATRGERRRAHVALAAASDPVRAADLRAWHLAAAAVEPDEQIAAELERTAERARSRGGWASAASFLGRAADLTLSERARAERRLACAQARLLADQPGAARTMLREALPALEDPLSRCRAARLSGVIDFTLGKPAAAAAEFVEAAKMYGSHDRREARDTLLEAFDAAHLAGGFADVRVQEVLESVRSVPLDGAHATIGDELLDGFAVLQEAGDEVGIPIIHRALTRVVCDQPSSEAELSWLPLAWVAAAELYDDRLWQAITSRWGMAARMRGTVVALPIGLGRFPYFDVVVGRFTAAENAFAEARELASATGRPARPVAYSTSEVAALAWRGREEQTRSGAETLVAELTGLGRGMGLRMVHLSTAVLELGLGNYRPALRAAQQACADDPLVHLNATAELIEAAARSGEVQIARRSLERIGARACASGTDWALGMLRRSEALLAQVEDAEELYEAAIDHLARTLLVPQLGRAHLVYGEWLRRQRRRRDARRQLRAAFDVLDQIGVEAFAERARMELLATGERARSRARETTDQLTAQEERVARLASEGASNTDIATQLFISVPTVVYHLRKAFRKLDISNRASLARALREHGNGPGGAAPHGGAAGG